MHQKFRSHEARKNNNKKSIAGPPVLFCPPCTLPSYSVLPTAAKSKATILRPLASLTRQSAGTTASSQQEALAAMAAAKPILYSAWISSCSFRVRIALNLKGVDYEYRAVTRDNPDYEKINPIKYVPALVDGDFVVSDSLAIILYLEEKYPQHPLLPQDLKKKAINLQIANIVCSSIQPLQCYAVIGLLDGKLGSDESLQIVQRYIDKGFRAIEKLLEGCDSKYATGDKIQLADVFLAPQIHAGVTRFQIDMSNYPILDRFYKAYMELPAFKVAAPEKQPDAPASPY